MCEGLADYREGSRRIVNAYGGRRRVPDTVAHAKVELAGDVSRLKEVSAIDMGERSRASGFPIGGLWGLDLIKRRKLTFDLTNGVFRIER